MKGLVLYWNKNMNNSGLINKILKPDYNKITDILNNFITYTLY